jgi:NADPH-dependent glutamate synthase beta subunit-like oxidoreductase
MDKKTRNKIKKNVAKKLLKRMEEKGIGLAYLCNLPEWEVIVKIHGEVMDITIDEVLDEFHRVRKK